MKSEIKKRKLLYDPIISHLEYDGWTQTSLANETGLQHRTIKNFLNYGDVKIDTLLAIADAVGFDFELLLK